MTLDDGSWNGGTVTDTESAVATEGAAGAAVDAPPAANGAVVRRADASVASCGSVSQSAVAADRTVAHTRRTAVPPAGVIATAQEKRERLYTQATEGWDSVCR